jgi:hypothetical protein
MPGPVLLRGQLQVHLASGVRGVGRVADPAEFGALVPATGRRETGVVLQHRCRVGPGVQRVYASRGGWDDDGCGDGPQPSEQMIAAIARGLRLTPDERDHLFLLAGYRTARRDLRLQHVSPGLMRVMDGLAGTTAQVTGPLGETLLQTPSAVALLGDGPGAPAADLADILLRTSDEFARLWERHEVGLRWSETKRFVHPQVGQLDLYCQLLFEPDQGQSLLIFTATPGTESHEKLALLTVLGTDHFAADTE